MTTFEHVPHRRVTDREPPAQSSDEFERIGFNGRLGAAITRGVGTMWAFYIATVFMAGWMLLAEAHIISFDPYPYPFLLFLGNIVQLLLMFVILVGQQVLGRATDKRAVQTYQDAEAILHECLELQRHLTVQDHSLDALIARMERLSGQATPSSR